MTSRRTDRRSRHHRPAPAAVAVLGMGAAGLLLGGLAPRVPAPAPGLATGAGVPAAADEPAERAAPPRARRPAPPPLTGPSAERALGYAPAGRRPAPPPLTVPTDQAGPEPTTSTTTPEEPAPEAEVVATEAAPEDPPEAEAPPSCNGADNLRVAVRAADGGTVDAQVSADFSKHGRKVDASGQPIPSDQYSLVEHVTTTDGRQELCVGAAPGTKLYVEVYPKVVADGVAQGPDDRYGSVMWHGVWPGRGQGVTLTLPRACEPGTRGRTGAVRVSAAVNGTADPTNRLVAWSRASNSASRTPGFGVSDAAHLHVPTVETVNLLAPDQDYLVQVQTLGGVIATVDGVPVRPCQETTVDLAVDDGVCQATIGGEPDPTPCRLISKLVG